MNFCPNTEVDFRAERPDTVNVDVFPSQEGGSGPDEDAMAD